MNPILEKVLVAAIGVIVPAILGWLGALIVKYNKLIKKEKDAVIQNTIVDTLKPIQTDISSMKTDISKMKTDIRNLQNSEINFETRLAPTQEEIEHMKDDITEILDQIKSQGVDIDNL